MEKIFKESHKMTREKVEQLTEKYENLMYEINLEEANGDLAKLVNLQDEFDTTFDYFFDQEEICKKYGEWDYEEEQRLLEKSNNDLLEELDEEDLLEYIEFYQNYLVELEEELKELKEVI